jgi:dipeptidyl aminopeptidase/acylaminoacyl peptidase
MRIQVFKKAVFVIGMLIITGLSGCKKELSCEDCLNTKQPPTDHPPVANAGNDTTIMLPANTVNLNGSLSFDPDSNITDYLWTNISGPSSFNITDSNAVQTTVTNLVQGVYLFELKVTDADGLFNRDTIQVTVENKPAPCTNCQIVFVSNRDGNSEIYSCNADGSNISRLTNNAATDDQPAWSPDRSHIAFVSDRDGSPEIYIMNADGSNVVRRTFSQVPSQNPAWSPDGTRIAYSTDGANGGDTIWVVGAESGSPSPLLPLLERFGGYGDPSWSPDGTKLVLVNLTESNQDAVYTVNSDGTNFTQLGMLDTTNFLAIYFARYPTWSPDGMNIAVSYTQHRNDVYYQNSKICVMKPDGSGLITIIANGDPDARTSWSTDGTRILYTSLSGSREDISWVSPDGSVSGTIVTNGWNADWQH